MKYPALSPHLILGITSLTLTGFVPAAEFESLFDGKSLDGWQGDTGSFEVVDETLRSKPQETGYLYTREEFRDFVVRFDFRLTPGANNGIGLRYPGWGIASQTGMGEIQILDDSSPRYTKWRQERMHGGVYGLLPAQPGFLRPVGEWNEQEITVLGSTIRVTLNGQAILETDLAEEAKTWGRKKLATQKGWDRTSGHLCLCAHRSQVDFRNIQVRRLEQPGDTFTEVETDPDQPRIEVISEQGPNAVTWALAPMDEAVPPGIRRNLLLLREDLLDEAESGPEAPREAYDLATVYCDRIIAALDTRESSRVSAGYRAAQADADIKVSNAQLDARRNYQMSWPQYQREKDQRAALRNQEQRRADLKKERARVDWAKRAQAIRNILTEDYRKLRAAMR